MTRKNSLQRLGLVVLLGSAWGISEALLGLGLRSCSKLISGSAMTAVALFFLAAGLTSSRRKGALALLVLLAASFKLFDALLLSLPLKHGAVVNPVFAFCTEAFVFLVISSLASAWTRTSKGRIMLGGLSGLAAAAAFPLAGVVTGVPACLLPGTSIPLAWAFAPLAAALSALTVPLGIWAGRKLEQAEAWLSVLSPASVLLSLALMVLIRLG